MKYKSKDIARELGVSTATISLVLNNKPGVSDKKREEIINKIKELNCEYLLKPELAERGNIGFVIYKCGGSIIDEFPFFNYLMEGINHTVKKRQYNMNIIYMDQSDTLEEQLDTLATSGCQGFIIYAVEMDDQDLAVFHSVDLPCVFLDNAFSSKEVDTISINNYLGVFQAIEHLYEMGHRRIGYIKSSVSISSFRERYEAFTKVMKEKHLQIHNPDIMTVGYLEKETIVDIKDYLDQKKQLPTAFFADNDLLACRCVQALKETGYRVPEDVSVIGFDNRPICSFTEPHVSTIEVPRDDMGGAAVDLLMAKLEGNRRYAVKTYIGTKLKKRDSVLDISSAAR